MECPHFPSSSSSSSCPCPREAKRSWSCCVFRAALSQWVLTWAWPSLLLFEQRVDTLHRLDRTAVHTHECALVAQLHTAHCTQQLGMALVFSSVLSLSFPFLLSPPRPHLLFTPSLSHLVPTRPAQPTPRPSSTSSSSPSAITITMSTRQKTLYVSGFSHRTRQVDIAYEFERYKSAPSPLPTSPFLPLINIVQPRLIRLNESASSQSANSTNSHIRDAQHPH